MKTLLLSFVAVYSLHAQSQAYYDTINHNNTSGLISSEGTVFEDMDNGTPGYEVPKGSGLHAIYSTQFWFAAKDSLGNIRTSLGGHSQQGHDVYPGPYSYYHNYDSTYYANYGEAIWSICQAEIDEYVAWWECDVGLTTVGCGSISVPSNQILTKINSWPAHGNIANGEDYFQAPFYDRDGDGSYDPTQGDVPLIKGCCATYMIQNDDTGIHTQSGTDPIGLEIHSMFYHYKTWNYLNDVTFVEVTTKNTGPDHYTDFTYGVRVDAALGNIFDDSFGCDSTTNMMYFYNSDNDDDSFYGIDPPAIGVVALDQPMNNCTTGSTGFSVGEIWNVMNGLEPLGTPIMHPDGYPTTYTFSDDPNDPTGWSQYATGNLTNDTRGMMTSNHGPIAGVDNYGWTMPEEVTQTYAILYARNGDHLQNVQQLFLDAADVKDFHDNDSDIPCEGWWWSLDEVQSSNFSVYPNPVSDIVNVNNDLGLEMNLAVLNIEGKIVYSEKQVGTNAYIDVSSLNTGIYLLQITSDAGSFVKRLVIN